MSVFNDTTSLREHRLHIKNVSKSIEVVFFHVHVKGFAESTSLNEHERRHKITSKLSGVVFFHALVSAFSNTTSLIVAGGGIKNTSLCKFLPFPSTSQSYHAE